ncbi:MAG: glycine--tRNA ligase subunit beta [Syntrophales bacterium]|nr:glycine--tRNA ligase subunit beta [Syntrophales bacterium]
MGKELLLEIGTEEIPAAFLPKAMEAMAETIKRAFREGRISHGDVITMSTPRRLILCVKDVAEKQEDQVVEKLGPAKAVAFDEKGEPTKAARGFASSQGLEVKDLLVVKTEKGEYVCARKTLSGVATASLLPDMLKELILSLPFPKSMRWGNFNIRFARPIHWILALFGGEIVSFSLEYVKSGNESRGHRFMSPHTFEVVDFNDYLKKTKANYVICDPEERRKIILEQAQKVAQAVSGRPMENEKLLEEVVFLVEYPVALLGGFDPLFLQLPREVLTTCMMSHQKYFPVLGEEGQLLPYFVTIANTSPADASVVIKGNEKVIRARLTDAQFFFDADLKVPLEKRLEELKAVTYHRLLGTSYEKVERFRALARFIVEKVDVKLIDRVDRVAFLAKADLNTQMVGEFPELQGIMGREYAKHQGEDPTIAQAIYEHYLPISAGGELPKSDEGAIVSIADKLDTICGFFGVNLPPTGTADPYALRRQALGIINIILARGYHLNLAELIDYSLHLLKDKITESPETVKESVMEFFRGRLENYLLSQGYRADMVQAVISTGIEDLGRCVSRIKALLKFTEDSSFLPLTYAFKRVGNIIKGQTTTGAVNPNLFQAMEERRLWEEYLRVEELVRGIYLPKEDYLSALKEMASLREPIDAFFDHVLVMVEEEEIRVNRISLLGRIAIMFRLVADFSRLVVEG